MTVQQIEEAARRGTRVVLRGGGGSCNSDVHGVVIGLQKFYVPTLCLKVIVLDPAGNAVYGGSPDDIYPEQKEEDKQDEERTP